MPKKLGSAIEAAKGRGEDKLLSTKREKQLSEIRDRPHGDTREITPTHVDELAENIAAVGLIQPLVVDSQGHLLAGGHRRAALQKLKQEQPERFLEFFPRGEVPVRVFDFNAADDPERAIAIEAAENEQRRDYTPAEVRELADRLVAAGYRNTKGKPKKGQKALTPALMTIVGKSRRTVQSYLAGDNVQRCTLSDKEKEQQFKGKLTKMLEQFELMDSTNEALATLAAKLREQLKMEA